MTENLVSFGILKTTKQGADQIISDQIRNSSLSRGVGKRRAEHEAGPWRHTAATAWRWRDRGSAATRGRAHSLDQLHGRRSPGPTRNVPTRVSATSGSGRPVGQCHLPRSESGGPCDLAWRDGMNYSTRAAATACLDCTCSAAGLASNLLSP